MPADQAARRRDQRLAQAADAVGPDLLPHARRAVSACPTLALRLLRTRADGRARR
jgi:hypothetical protein